MTMYNYQKDHLCNVRVTKVGVGEGGSVLQRMNYYPFGGMMASSTGGAVQPYRYTGKELVRFQGLDWLDYGARWYDPAQRVDTVIYHDEKKFMTSKSSKWQRGRRIVSHLTEVFRATQIQ